MSLKETDYREFKERQKVVFLENVVDIPVQIAYTDIGKNEPIILLHGIPTWSYLYHQVIDDLAKHYRVIAPDFLGHGFSDKRDLFDRSLEVQVKMVLELLIFLKIESAHIIGHDTGGGVALILAIKHPEKVNKLILSNAVAYDSWPIDDMLALGNPKWKSKTSQEIAAFLLEGYKLGLSNPKTLSKTFQEGIIAPYLADEGKISLIRNAASLNTNHTVSIMSRHKEVRSETLLLWGIDDPWQTISDAIRLHREIPNSKLVQLDKASHWLQQDAPDRYLKNLLNFLSN